MDFDLDRMGWRQFEHLIQALSIRELGNGVQVFGDGTDGGREATFNGPVDFPAGGQAKWNGYGIIQAKHKGFPSGDPQRNADSVIGDIRSELKQFLPDASGKAKRKHKPEYYLLATNVRLSAQEDLGGLDRVVAELRSWETKLGLRGTHVWHYANICRYLEANESIRRAFAGFITPGDVLSEVLNHFGAATGAVGLQLKTHAAQQLRSKQWVQLGDSGGAQDEKLALSEVGVDLPALLTLPGVHGESAEPLAVGVLRHVLERGDSNLREGFEASSGVGLVVVGGPGQGKSTLGQLICQFYRASLLSDTPPSQLPPAVSSVLAATRELMTKLDIPVPANRRWPVHVELAKYGDALSADPATSLLKFIAAGIVVKGEALRANQLDRWKTDWPWLVVLDGLDEVAALETRIRVIEQVADFVTECRLNDQDVLIVATTRPQGYHGEFAEFEPEQLELRNLTASEGLDYAKGLVAIRHPDDPEAAREVVERLVEASNSELTSRLMRTPLQVTIMTMLLEAAVRVPATKHALFDAYYSTIYSREIGRAGTLGSLLERHREHIDFVHEQVGLRLQIRSELAGEADAMLSDQELERLFQWRLESDGYEQKEVALLSDELLRAAKNRVVLLVGTQADQVAFEVRSLQEYMAARALGGGTDEQLLERIDALSPSSFWRHTLLLLIGRIFARAHLRDSVVGRLRLLDTSTDSGMFLGYGEMLAIDLLEDDLAFAVPRIRRAFLEHALDSLRRWPRPELRKLSEVARPYLDQSETSESRLVQRMLREAFESSGRARVSAVAVLRNWQANAGAAGAFARLLLNGDDSWRPRDESQDLQDFSLADLVGDLIPADDLSEEDAAVRETLLDLLAHRRYMRDLSAAELTAHADKRITLAEALEFQGALERDELANRLTKAVDAMPVSDGAAASWIQQLIATLEERRIVGSDPRVVAAIEGTP